MKDTRRKTWPVCPHCGYQDYDAWEMGFKFNEEEMEVDCPSCEKPYTIMIHIDTCYSTSVPR